MMFCIIYKFQVGQAGRGPGLFGSWVRAGDSSGGRRELLGTVTGTRMQPGVEAGKWGRVTPDPDSSVIMMFCII